MPTLDLDAVEVPKLDVKLNGKTISLNPPSAQAILTLSKLALELEGYGAENADQIDDKKVMQVLNAIGEVVYKFNPELKDENISFSQMIGLMQFLITAGTPGDVKELKKRGISTAPDSKKKSVE